MSKRLFKDEVYTIVGAPRDLLFVSFVDPVISLEARPPRIERLACDPSCPSWITPESSSRSRRGRR